MENEEPINIAPNEKSQLFLRLDILGEKLDMLLSRKETQTQLPPEPVPQVDKPLYTAVCCDCRKQCTVPFKPHAGGAIRCKDCYKKVRGY